MKVFLLPPRENWIVDRFCKEWQEHNEDITSYNPQECDVFWLIADWVADQVPHAFLKSKKVLTSVHHIVPGKFGDRELLTFKTRDAFTHAYHVPCEKTAQQVRDIQQKIGSHKPIHVRPFWVNNELWVPAAKFLSKRALELDIDTFYVASFQRDTEGHDLVSPKLEKGPDIFCDVVEKLRDIKENSNVTALLGGWRRQYVTNRLHAANIPYVYNELPGFEVLRMMYNACDVYVVGSRFEGGPQAIFECATMRVPIVSTDVGAAAMILDPKSIFDKDDPDSFFPAVQNACRIDVIDDNEQRVKEHHLKNSFPWFRNLLESI